VLAKTAAPASSDLLGDSLMGEVQNAAPSPDMLTQSAGSKSISFDFNALI
jgi:hypothetical protein